MLNNSFSRLSLTSEVIFCSYDGGKGIWDWLVDCELCFEIFGMPDPKKTKVAGLYLEGVEGVGTMFARDMSHIIRQDFYSQPLVLEVRNKKCCLTSLKTWFKPIHLYY